MSGARASRVGADRVVGVDVARGLALIGMVVAHAAPRPHEEWIVDGRSSLLFATLAGVSLGLMTARASGPSERSRFRIAASVRALLLAILGVILWALPTDIAIILDYYGVMFLLLVPVLFAPRIVLAALAAVLFAVAPLVADLVERWADAVARDPAADLPDALLWLLVDRTLTGYYPALVWLPLLLVGLLAARSDVRRTSVQLAMIAGGALGMLLGYGAAAVLPDVDASAHAATHAELLGSGGFAFAVIGACIAVCRWRVMRVVLAPVSAMGSMPLTVYTAQILVIAWLHVEAGSPAFLQYESWTLVVGYLVAAAVFVLVWRRVIGTGPLEWGVRALARPPVTRASG